MIGGDGPESMEAGRDMFLNLGSGTMFAQTGDGVQNNVFRNPHTGWSTRASRTRPAPVPDGDIPPSRLLGVHHRLCPLIGMEDDLANLSDWCTNTRQTYAVRVLYGPGGRGKTRLAMEVTAIAADTGWAVWTVGLEQTARNLDVPTKSTARGHLFVIDYAERWPYDTLESFLAKITDHLDVDVPVRVLMLARYASWWRGSSGLDAAGAVHDIHEIPPLPTGGATRNRMFRSACTAYAATDLYRGHVNADALATPEGLGLQAAYSDPLAIQMAALVAVDSRSRGEAPPRDAADLSHYLLQRELRHWGRMHHQQPGHSTDDITMAKTVYCATLLGEQSLSEALNVLERAKVINEGDHRSGKRVLTDHAHCYPVTKPVTVLTPMLPDRLAEDFLALHTPLTEAARSFVEPVVLAWSKHAHPSGERPPLVPDLTSEAAGWLLGMLATLEHDMTTGGRQFQPTVHAHRAMTVLVETAKRWPHIAHVLTRILDWQPHLASAAGGIVLSNLAGIDAIPTATLAKVASKFPNNIEADLEIGVVAVQRALVARIGPSTDIREHLDRRARLTERYARAGMIESAITEATRLIDIARPLTKSDPLLGLPALAGGLNYLAVLLTHKQSLVEAVPIADEVANIARRLAILDPGEYRVFLAHTLLNRGGIYALQAGPMSRVDYLEQALEVFRESSCITEDILYQPSRVATLLDAASQRPNTAISVHVRALTGQQVALRMLGRTSEANHIAEQIRSIYELNADFSGDHHWLEKAEAESAAVDMSKNEFDTIIRTAQGTIHKLRAKASSNPHMYLTQLIAALERASTLTFTAGNATEAATLAQEAEDLLSHLNETQIYENRKLVADVYRRNAHAQWKLKRSTDHGRLESWFAEDHEDDRVFDEDIEPIEFVDAILFGLAGTDYEADGDRFEEAAKHYKALEDSDPQSSRFGIVSVLSMMVDMFADLHMNMETWLTALRAFATITGEGENDPHFSPLDFLANLTIAGVAQINVLNYLDSDQHDQPRKLTARTVETYRGIIDQSDPNAETMKAGLAVALVGHAICLACAYQSSAAREYLIEARHQWSAGLLHKTSNEEQLQLNLLSKLVWAPQYSGNPMLREVHEQIGQMLGERPDFDYSKGHESVDKTPANNPQLPPDLTSDGSVGDKDCLRRALASADSDPIGTSARLSRIVQDVNADGFTRMHAACYLIDYEKPAGIAAVCDLATNINLDINVRMWSVNQLAFHDMREALCLLNGQPFPVQAKIELLASFSGLSPEASQSLVSIIRSDAIPTRIRIDAVCKLPRTAIDALRSLAANEENGRELQLVAMASLAYYGNADERHDIQAQLAQVATTDDEVSIRITAAQQLCRLLDGRGQKILTDIADGATLNMYERLTATLSLGSPEARQSRLETLLALARAEGNAWDQFHLYSAMAGQGVIEGIEWLRQTAKSTDTEPYLQIRSATALAAAERDPTGTGCAVLAQLGSDPKLYPYCVLAASELTAYDHLRGIGLLKSLLDDDSCRPDAAAHLADLGDADVLPLLREALNDPNTAPFDRITTAKGLGWAGDPQGVEKLQSIVNDTSLDDDTRFHAKSTLEQFFDNKRWSLLSLSAQGGCYGV